MTRNRGVQAALIALGAFVWASILLGAYFEHHGLYRQDFAFLAFAFFVPFLIILVGGPILIFVAARNALAGQWLRAISIASSLALMIASLAISNHVIDIVRLKLFESHYVQHSASYSLREGKVRIYPWGDCGFAGSTNIFLTLVYDETGNLRKPREQRSEEWLKVVDPSLEGSFSDARHGLDELVGNYSVLTSAF